MKPYTLVAFALFACSPQKDGPVSSAITAIGDVANVELQMTACNATLQRTVLLDVSAAGHEVSLEQLTIADARLGNGDVQLEGPASVPPDHGFRLKCVDHRDLDDSDATRLDGTAGEANITIVIATEDSSADPVLIARVTTVPRAFDNCQNVLVPAGCTIVSEL